MTLEERVKKIEERQRQNAFHDPKCPANPIQWYWLSDCECWLKEDK